MYKAKATAFVCLALVVFLLPVSLADGQQQIGHRAATASGTPEVQPAPNKFKAAAAAATLATTAAGPAELKDGSGPPTRVYVIVFFKTFFATLAFAAVLALLGYGLWLAVRRIMEWRRNESVEYVSLIIAG